MKPLNIAPHDPRFSQHFVFICIYLHANYGGNPKIFWAGLWLATENAIFPHENKKKAKLTHKKVPFQDVKILPDVPMGHTKINKDIKVKN